MNMIKVFRKNLQVQIGFIYVLLVLLPISILGIYSLNVFSEEIETIVVETTRETIQHQLQTINDLYDRMNDVTLDITLRQDIISMLMTFEGLVDVQGISDYNFVRQQLRNIAIRRSEVDDVAVVLVDFAGEGTAYLEHVISASGLISVDDISQRIWYQEHLVNPRGILMIANVNATNPDTYPGGIAFVRSLQNIQRHEQLGLVVTTITNRQLQRNITAIGNPEDYSQLVLDSLGNVLMSTFYDDSIKDEFLNQRSVGELIVDNLVPYSWHVEGEDYLVISGISELSGIEITYIISKNAIFYNVHRIREINIFIMFVCLILSFALIAMIFKKVIKPIKAMQKSMSLVGQGDSHMQVVASDSNEIGKLADSFNRMVIGIEQKNLQLVEQEKRKHEYELMILQYQINPHFLYNTLDSIKWLAVAGGNATIEKISQALIVLLRKTISNPREFITIREELDNLENYIEIQKIRYYNSFDYLVDADGEMLNGLIPKLILQPLVENALFHGVYDCGRRGIIKVTVKREGSDCMISIYDNGRGMEIEKMERLLNFRNPNKIGLGNVDERIKLYYGQDYGLAFESKKEEYSVVIMKIPYRMYEGV